MIKINIENKKNKIKKYHKIDFGRKQGYKKIKDKLDNLKGYTNFYNWFQNSKGVLDEKKIEKLICTDSKLKIIELINQFEPLIYKDAGSNLLLVKKVKEEIQKEFENLFKNFSKRKWAYNFLEEIDAKVCPYCNRSYTFTVVNRQKPELDHYFPKSQYPYLAISIFNIVPCCSGCNKGKSDNYVDVINQPICYPYEESFDDKIVFETDFDELDAWFDENKKLSIILSGDAAYTDIIKAYNEAFKIDYLYTQHNDYAREIIKKSIIFNDDFFESIYCSFPEAFSSSDEVKQMIYSNYLELDEVGKRPLSKLTQDLLKEYNVKFV
ncbi:HNH endonuclease domain-containing protein [Clostridium akagii]|uniref:HNH endonuclease domain-containing protein n=1 Tax=Clostridium akagii TaxID=91623 RepID=UPI00047BE888|nr:HNH endonuclease domain-containing protein [Clostridium akagii]